MREKENVPAGGGTPTGTGQEKRQGVAAVPHLYFTTPPAQRQAIYKSLRAIAFEVNRIAAIIQLAELETGDDG